MRRKSINIKTLKKELLSGQINLNLANFYIEPGIPTSVLPLDKTFESFIHSAATAQQYNPVQCTLWTW